MIHFLQNHRWILIVISPVVYWLLAWFFSIPKVEKFIEDTFTWIVLGLFFLLYLFFTSPKDFHKEENKNG